MASWYNSSWKERAYKITLKIWDQYPKEERIRIKKEISGIISTLKNSVKKHRIDRNFARLECRIDITQKELLPIANDLLSRNKDSNTAKFILRTAGKVTLFAELTTRGIQIPDNNNHVENLIGIVGHRIKKNRQHGSIKIWKLW